MNAAAARAASPCVSVCRLDSVTGWCVGCGRSGEEIGFWRAASEAERDTVFDALPQRLAVLDPVPLHRGGRDAAEAALAPVLAGEGGAVVVGCHGAVAEFLVAPGAGIDVVRDGDTLTAITRGGRLRVDLTAAVAVFADEEGGAAVLAVPDNDERLPKALGLAPIGEDPSPVRGRGTLFDVGLGFGTVRFMVRTADEALAARLAALEGAPLDRLLAEAGAALLEASPTRVVESMTARVEVDGPIPLPGGRSPLAPHTHLMPGAVRLRRLLPPGLCVPEDMVPVAIVYPPAA